MSGVSWLRLEPKMRNSSMQGVLEARLYDPLWTLGRQWQLGEFEGENGGSPVSVEVEGKTNKLFMKNGEGFCSQPLEALVEREPITTGESNTYRSVQIGSYLLDMLNGADLASLCGAVKQGYPLNVSEQIGDNQKTRGLLTLLSGRSVDGSKLYEDYLNSDVNISDKISIDNNHKNNFHTVMRHWIKWCRELYSEPILGTSVDALEGDSLWKNEQLEYHFSIEDGEMEYSADEYYSGSLDWYSFDERKKESPEEGVSFDEEMVQLFPTPLEFSGMPKLRYWELEDEGVNFPAVPAEGSELLRMIFVDFTMNYGNDWFMVPLKLDVGTMNRIKSLTVKDSFGTEYKITPPENEVSDWFELSDDKGNIKDRGLFLAPVLPQGLESKPVETVEFIKDEMANMAWAIEVLVEGKSGIGERRISSDVVGNEAASVGSDNPMYQLESKVPDNWMPLLLQVKASEMQLILAGKRPEGKLLKASSKINEEEIIREGITVTRTHQYVRWSDGSTHVWTGRKKKTGRGERSSGIQFDQIVLNAKDS